MDKSQTITVRLSNEELNIVKNFREKYQIKAQNDFFRFAIAVSIPWMEIIMQLVTNVELNSKVDQYRKDVQSKLKNASAENTDIQKLVDGYEKNILSEIDKVINNAVEQVKSFTQDRSAGRPPNPKVGPGRPKEEGY